MPDRYVDFINGNDMNDGLSWATAWKTLGKAASSTLGGETCHFAPGETDETVTFNNPDGGRTFTTDGNYTALYRKAGAGYITVDETYTVFDGFTVRRATGSTGVFNIIGGGATQYRNIHVFAEGPVTGGAVFRINDYFGSRDIYISQCSAVHRAEIIYPYHFPVIETGYTGVGYAVRFHISRCTFVVLGDSPVIKLYYGGSGDSSITIYESIIDGEGDTQGKALIWLYANWDSNWNTVTHGNRNILYTRGPNTYVAWRESTGVGIPFSQWQSTSRDVDSQDTDPLHTSREYGMFTLRPTSPALTMSLTGSYIGPFGRGVGAVDTNAWAATVGTGTTWTFGGGAGYVGGGDNGIALLTDPEGTAEMSILGALNPGDKIKRVRFYAKEVTDVGPVSRIVDTTPHVAGQHNPPTVGAMLNDLSTPGPYVDRQRGQEFLDGGGQNLHLRFLLRSDGTVR